MIHVKRYFAILAVGLMVACNSEQSSETVFTVDSNGEPFHALPVYTDLPQDLLDVAGNICLQSNTDQIVSGQIEEVSDAQYRLWWLASSNDGEPVRYSLVADAECGSESFNWHRITDESIQLRLGQQALIQYEHPVYNPDEVEMTKKPFHHLFDPAGGDLITKGPGGLYSHHRGIFFGYNHVYINDEQIDIWHARDGERSEHLDIIREITGPVTGGHLVTIGWKDHDGNVFLDENREIRIFSVTDNVVIVDFKSTLQAIDTPVILDGDRQHAGVQFRAAQYVAENADQTRFIRPEYLEHLDQDNEISGDEMMDLPWNAMYFNVEGESYTVAYISHPSNPENAEMSERLYGRFGEFFRYELDEGESLTVNYRFVITRGELAGEEIDRFSHFYTNPPVVELQ